MEIWWIWAYIASGLLIDVAYGATAKDPRIGLQESLSLVVTFFFWPIFLAVAVGWCFNPRNENHDSESP